jgi:hypothetical protein
MSKSQRTKGAAYERELAQIFTAFLGEPVKRNIGQARDGGNDIDFGPFVVEAKRRKSLKTLRGWYAQAVAAAESRFDGYGDVYPVVVMREDSGSSMVLLSLPDFLDLARERFASHPE